MSKAKVLEWAMGALLLWQPLLGCPECCQAQTTPMQTRQVFLAVTGMTCGLGCTARVQKALLSLPWVRKAEVRFNEQIAIVTVDASRLDEKALVDVVQRAGYGARVIKR